MFFFLFQQGEVDCWPLPCPEVDCEFSVVPESECCPRCINDPCQADIIRNDITKTCVDETNVVRFTGSSWIKHGTECTLCQCKVKTVIVFVYSILFAPTYQKTKTINGSCIPKGSVNTNFRNRFYNICGKISASRYI